MEIKVIRAGGVELAVEGDVFRAYQRPSQLDVDRGETVIL